MSRPKHSLLGASIDIEHFYEYSYSYFYIGDENNDEPENNQRNTS